MERGRIKTAGPTQKILQAAQQQQQQSPRAADAGPVMRVVPGDAS